MTSFKQHCPDKVKIKSGVKLPLYNADGSLSDDYLMVRWVWDDPVRSALDNLRREGQERITQIKPEMSAKENKAAKAQNKAIEKELVMDGFIAQVASWSFDEKPTKANMVAFFTARPDVAERVDILASNNKVFFTESGRSS